MQEGILCDVHIPSRQPQTALSRKLLCRKQAHTLTRTPNAPARALKFSYLVGRRANDEAPICFTWFDVFFALKSTFCAKITVFSFNQPLLFVVYTHFQLFLFLYCFFNFQRAKPLTRSKSFPSVTVVTIVTVEQVLLSSYLRQ